MNTKPFYPLLILLVLARLSPCKKALRHTKSAGSISHSGHKLGKSTVHLANEIVNNKDIKLDPGLMSCIKVVPEIAAGFASISSGSLNIAEFITHGSKLLYEFKDCGQLLHSHVKLNHACRA